MLNLLYGFVITFTAQASASRSCKVTPDSPNWPSISTWRALNDTVSGRLLQPPPPGAVCHTSQPTYNAAACPAVQEEWQSIFFHQDNPISSAWNNFNNDSCLPVATAPCSGKGYSVYVVNATTPEHIQAAVKFAGKHNVRLIVKGTGHDYLGRYELVFAGFLVHVCLSPTDLAHQTRCQYGHII